MASIIIVPGWRDSGPGHWQSLWAQALPDSVRVQQDDWITPTRSSWVASITRTILERAEPVVIVAHSLGCIAVTHLLAQATARIQGELFAGHINIESGFGAWPLGLALLQSLTGEGSFTNNGLSHLSNSPLETA